MTTVTFRRAFCAAHRLWRDTSKCRNVHGHNYAATITVSRIGPRNENGFVVAFDVVKAAVDVYDHALVLELGDPLIEAVSGYGLNVVLLDDPPSTENLALAIADAVAAGTSLAELGPVDVTVRLEESASIAATASAGRA